MYIIIHVYYVILVIELVLHYLLIYNNNHILPKTRCSNCVVTQLKQLYYNVTYYEFNGSHTVNNKCKSQAIDLLNKTIEL